MIYYTPYLGSTDKAAGIRAKCFSEAFDSEDLTIITSDQKSLKGEGRTLLKMPNNRSSFVWRLFVETNIGVQLFLRFGLSKRKVFLSTPPYFAAIYFCFWRRIIGKPYSLDIRDLYPEVLESFGVIKKGTLISKLFRWISQFMYDGASEIVFATNGLENAVTTKPTVKKLTVLNGFDENEFKHTSDLSSQNVVFHGTLARFQDVDLVLNVAKELATFCPSAKIQIAGDGPQREKVEGCGLPNLQYFGSMNRVEIRELLLNATVGLSFRTDSEYDRLAFPVKIFEYIGSGVPSIVYPECEGGDVVEAEGIGFMFKVRDAKAIAEKIREIIESPDLRESLRTRLEEARPRFSRQTQAQKLRPFLEQK